MIHCYAQSASWFLINWNCSGTRCALKPWPNLTPSPPPPSSGKNDAIPAILWSTECNYWTCQCFGRGFSCDVCATQTQPLIGCLSATDCHPAYGKCQQNVEMHNEHYVCLCVNQYTFLYGSSRLYFCASDVSRKHWCEKILFCSDSQFSWDIIHQGGCDGLADSYGIGTGLDCFDQSNQPPVQPLSKVMSFW